MNFATANILTFIEKSINKSTNMQKNGRRNIPIRSASAIAHSPSHTTEVGIFLADNACNTKKRRLRALYYPAQSYKKVEIEPDNRVIYWRDRTKKPRLRRIIELFIGAIAYFYVTIRNKPFGWL